MFNQFKNAFGAFCLLACFPIYSLGQILLFLHNNNHPDLYIGISKFSSTWIFAHLVLMLSLLLMVPAFLAMGSFLKNRNYPIWFGLSFFFLMLYIFGMFGQYTIDLCLVELFKLPQDKAYLLMEKIQTNNIIEPLFFDSSRIFFLFKYLDFWFISQIFLAGSFLLTRKLPKWELAIFFTALIVTQLGALTDPFYGKIIKSLGYTLFSFAYFPIAVYIFKNKKNRTNATDL